MLSPLEQEKIMRLAGHLSAANKVLADVKRSPAPRISPKAAQQTVRRAQAQLREFLKEAG